MTRMQSVILTAISVVTIAFAINIEGIISDLALVYAGVLAGIVFRG